MAISRPTPYPWRTMSGPQRFLQLTVTLVAIGCAGGASPAAAPPPVVLPAGARVPATTGGLPASGIAFGSLAGQRVDPPNVRLAADGRTIEPAVPGTPFAFPQVDGPLAPRVIYPRARQVIAVRDSNFLLGSVGSGDARLTINGASVTVHPNGAFLAWLPVPPRDRPRYELVVTKNGDTVRVVHEIAFPNPTTGAPPPPVTLTVPDVPTFVELQNSNEGAKSDTDMVTILRPTPAGTYKWFVHPRTIVELTGERGDWVRVRLDATLDAWLERKYVKPDARAANVRRTASNARVTANERWTDVRIPLTERTPFLIEERRDAVVLTLYNTVSNIDIINFSTDDAVVRDVTWEQASSDRVRVTVHLRQAPYGYLTLWDRGAFVLRMRRPPVVGDITRPLAGRVIAVDAGHPPIGSIGPTGLYEGDATLAVARALQPMLEAAGATVVMTRTAAGPVALGDRAIIARRGDAEVMVSIHLNAHPDGVNPSRTNGTGTYFFHHRAEPLARAVQRGMVRWMGLRDLGVNYDNLAVVRPTWFAAILCEGAFVILPDQEAALRTPEFQSRYAIGMLEGLEKYFSELSMRSNP